MATERNDYALDIPHLGSLILTHDLDGAVQGLKAVPPAVFSSAVRWVEPTLKRFGCSVQTLQMDS